MDISVIIPTYNRLWSLPTAIDSCRRTECETEIIVVDDGSTDGTWEWLQTQPDVVRIRQPNLGKPWAVNRGFASARGTYVRFLDSDDWLNPGASDRQMQIAQQQDADIVVAGYEAYSEAGELLYRVNWTDCDDFIAQQLGECNSSHYSAYLFRREFLKEIPHRPDFAYRDDRLFVLEVALAQPKVAVFEQATFCHRHHQQERLQALRGMKSVTVHLQQLMLYRRVLSQLAEQGDLTPRRRQAAAKVLWHLAHWIAYTHPEEADEVADWVFQLDPSFQIPEAGLLGQIYRSLGFRRTEALLQMRRQVLKLFKARSPQRFHQFPV
jgi:glycosyltransferase involved in cell wall biosynthesis